MNAARRLGPWGGGDGRAAQRHLGDGLRHALDVRLEDDRVVGAARVDARDAPLVVRELELGELQAVGGRHDDHALLRVDESPLAQLEEAREGDAGVRARVEPRPVGARAGVGELLLAGLLDDAVHRLERRHRARRADRVADLDGARQRLLGLDGLDHVLAGDEGAVHRVGALGLRHAEPRDHAPTSPSSRIILKPA